MIAGYPVKYIHGHAAMKPGPDYVVDENGCWNWQKTLDRDGYGVTWFRGRKGRAHRQYYEIAKGAIPEGMHVDHLCFNPRCVNPDHLEAVTPAENLKRRHIREGHSIKEPAV